MADGGSGRTDHKEILTSAALTEADIYYLAAAPQLKKPMSLCLYGMTRNVESLSLNMDTMEILWSLCLLIMEDMEIIWSLCLLTMEDMEIMWSLCLLIMEDMETIWSLYLKHFHRVLFYTRLWTPNME